MYISSAFFTVACGMIVYYVSDIIPYYLFSVRNYMRGPKCPSQARMDNKIVIVTGANTGIGFETAKNLLFRGKQEVLFEKDAGFFPFVFFLLFIFLFLLNYYCAVCCFYFLLKQPTFLKLLQVWPLFA